MTKITYIPGEIANAAIDEHGNRKPVTRTHHIFDDTKGKSQAEVNADIDDSLALHQSEINALDSQNYVTVDTFAELPATGAADTVYRVANYDGTQVVTNKYAEYAWNGTQYKLLDVKEHGIDDEPTAGSDNLVKSGGTDAFLNRKYGNYVSNIEYLYAVLDHNNRFLFGVRKDGTFVVGKSMFVEKDANKDLVIKSFSDNIHYGDNPEFVELHLDNEGNVLYGVRKDGSFVFNGVPATIKEYVHNVYQELKEYIDSKSEGEIELQESSFIPQEALASTNLKEVVLEGDVQNSKFKVVNNKASLVAAVSEFNNGNSNMAILLNANIMLDSTLIINNSNNKELSIDGNNHKLCCVGNDKQYNITGYSEGKAYAENTNSPINCAYITDTFECYKFNNSRFYDAKSRITDSEGNVFDTLNDGKGTGIRKFLLPSEFDGVTIGSADNVFVNFSAWFRTYTFKVVSVQYDAAAEKSPAGTYLYFNVEDPVGLNVDADYYREKSNKRGHYYTTFMLINVKNSNNEVAQHNNKLFAPLGTTTLGVADKDIIKVMSVNGKVQVSNVHFIGGNNSVVTESAGADISIRHCMFENIFGDYAIKCNEGNLSVKDCIFRNMWGGGISSSGNELYVTGNVFNNISLGRDNKSAIAAFSTKYYVAKNTIEDYGYCGISAGLIEMDTYKGCGGIIEYNVIKQSLKYLKDSYYRTILDSGAIYIGTNNNPCCTVRYNKIINYNGRGENRGIFLDDGAYNVYVIGNYLENIINSYAIEGRYETGRTRVGPQGQTLPDNINKRFIYNICDNGILLEGDKNTLTMNGNQTYYDNACYLGYNIFTKECKLQNVVRYVRGTETQIFNTAVLLEDGIAKLPVNLVMWNLV